MASLKRADILPKNYPPTPVRFPLPMFRLQLEAAARYLFEGERREALLAAQIPLDVLTGTGDPALNVAQIAVFMQALTALIGPDKATDFGHEAFQKMTTLVPRPTLTPAQRSVSSSDKLFLRVREAAATLNRLTSSNFIVKWHGGAEADIFEDTGQHCYGYAGDQLACATLTGYLYEAAAHLASVKMQIIESECMVTGALACRWHCKLA
ncbi:MAG: hypothetical protein ACYDBJ_27990 [Aggregatilineales bacterium]